MDKEEKELQIRIAKLNSKLQVDLASVFGALAASGAFAAVGYQLWLETYGIPLTDPRRIVSITLLLFAVFWSYAALYYNQKKKADVEEFENLKK